MATLVTASTAGSSLPPESKALPDPPTDGVTALSYLPDSSLLASTSWDGSLRVHDTTTEKPQRVVQHSMESGPLLSLAVLSKNQVATGGLDGSIRLLDMESNELQLVGRHESSSSADKVGCSCLVSLSEPQETPLLASAGWNKKFHVWDLRQQTPVCTLDLPGKAFGMDVDRSRNRCVIATSGRQTCFVDVVRSPQADIVATAEMKLQRESSLKYQTRTVRYFPDGAAIAMGSIEGRVAIEYLEDLGLPAKGKKFAFKCHRAGELVYPVNCIEFHPKFGTFATGGCDGTVVIWDGLNKKKIISLPSFPSSIAAMAFKPDGSELAIASSYTFEDGEREHPRDEIYVRSLLESECMPKSK